VEVSETTLSFDTKIKAPLYSRHGVPELWIVNLRHQELLCMRQPRLNGYAELETIKAPGRVTISTLSEVTVDLSGLFDDSDQPAS
jgi:Uma2 family endonuclease